MGQAGIFVLKNTTTGKQYVGQSKDINNQSKKQDSLMRNGRHYNSFIQQDYNRGHRFSFRVLEYCNQNQLNQRKNYWIKQLNTFNNGYNQTGRNKNMINTKNHSQFHQIPQNNTIQYDTKQNNTIQKDKKYENKTTKKDNESVKKIIILIIIIGILFFIYPPIGLFVFILYIVCYFIK